ncbi:serine/threonine-protein kinase [Antrihabitans sp. YC2-6]|uniref:serine/threonine-protein kinase n=1 Tax=Antrihabitans sp. YC2-6 TaxID=2799498 RepID=UPI0018F31DC9|nr:serine/threonine-protein kinase [Antrihabitans sp. YC2-6]MBJ8345988.1 serine/threonine protein kinase [Antrihabitans sp. YC2-6]
MTARAVADFAAAWQNADATDASVPDLIAYLPDAVAQRREILIELIRLDVQQRAKRPELTKPLSAYRAEFPELPAVAELAALVWNDDPTVHDLDSTHQQTVTAAASFDPLDVIDVGQRLDDFELLTNLGSGAFARVFLARQTSMQRLVAVKISENHGTEPQTLAQLDHDYIVRVFDQRLLPERDLRLLYMQYLPGGTLLDVLRKARKTTWTPQRSGQLLLDAIDEAMEAKGEIRPTDSSVRAELAGLTWPETVAWLGRRLAEALDYADKAGVLHRDIKPANVLLTAEGVPKLADFNISFARNLAGTNPVAYFGGSLAYMSPEQLAAVDRESAAKLDTRSDIYSLGVLLWELLTGRKPFPTLEHTTLDEMLALRLAGITDDALADLPPDTPPTLRRILLTCLAPDRDDRWSSGAELAKQFEICLNPPTRNLVDPSPQSWRYRLRPWIVPIVAACVAIPNSLASLYIIGQTQLLIWSRLSEKVQQRTDMLNMITNVVGFSLGSLLIAYLSRYLIRVSIGLRRGRTYSPEVLARARADAVLLADRIVAVCLSLWIVSAIVQRIGVGSIPPTALVHTLIAQFVSASMAVAYPFFLLTFYSIRCLYPTFLPYGQVTDDDARRLESWRRRGNFYLAVAAGVPLFGVAGVTFLNAGDIELVIVPLRILCVGSIAAFLLSYALFRLAEADMRALGAGPRVLATQAS